MTGDELLSTNEVATIIERRPHDIHVLLYRGVIEPSSVIEHKVRKTPLFSARRVMEILAITRLRRMGMMHELAKPAAERMVAMYFEHGMPDDMWVQFRRERDDSLVMGFDLAASVYPTACIDVGNVGATVREFLERKK